MNSQMLYSAIAVLLVLSWVKDKQKTKKSLMKAYKSFTKNVYMLMTIMILMGVVLTVVSPELISKILGEESGIFGVTLGLVLGSVSFMPSFIAFPLGAGLLNNGAGYAQIAGFISSLMGVGFVSLNMESQYFGTKTAVLRNFLAVIASVIFVIVIGGLSL